MKIETTLKNYIIERYGSVRAFAIKHEIPYTTVVTILQRGINNASLTSIKKICDALKISPDKLSEGKIVHILDSNMFETKDPVIDLNDLLASCKWTMVNNPVEFNGHILTEQEKATITTAIDISLEMIKANVRSDT